MFFIVARRWVLLSVLLIIFLVACQGTEPVQKANNDPLPDLPSETIVLLYSDSDVSLNSQSQQAVFKAGLADTSSVLASSKSSQEFTTQALKPQDFNYQEAAQVYAIMIANLLGQYQNYNVQLMPVSEYEKGLAQKSVRTFYLASTYGENAPQALIDDALSGAAITWMNYQIWDLVPDSDKASTGVNPLGFSFTQLHTAFDETSYTKTFNKVNYNKFTFNKYLAPMEMAEVKLERDDVTVHAWAENSSGKQIPYALQSDAFWYIADNPLVYIHETDRYLVFADLLGTMLGRTEACEPRAIARMEDLSPNDSAEDLKRLLDVLNKVDIPFAAATIPLYKNNTTQTQRTWQENPAALAQLERVPLMKGRIFQHGYTHQFEGLNNPFGESGVDFEFWQVSDDGRNGFNYLGPIAGQSEVDALARIKAGRKLLDDLNLPVDGWVTPHYAANPDFYEAFSNEFPRFMERRLYQVGDTVAGQFFPYPVKDISGALILPETLGSVQADFLEDRILKAAQANLALRCPWAGHFFHSFTLNPSYDGPSAISVDRFEQLLKDIQNLGYTYIDPNQVQTQ